MENKERINSITDWTKREKGYINVVYTIQLKRIEKGLSQSELSFLLGLPDTRISMIEQFSNPNIDYSIIDLAILTSILNCKIRDFYSDVYRSFEIIEIGVSKIADDYGFIFFEAYYREKNTYHRLYRVIDNSGQVRQPTSVKLAIASCINDLLQSNFFEKGVSPWNIYSYCKEHISSDFKPKDLLEVLNTSFLQGETIRLKKVKNDGRYSYFLHSVPLIEPEKS